MSACSEPTPTPLPSNVIVIGKCAFTGLTKPVIESGDVFLYALRDDQGNLDVLTGVSSTSDSLLDVTVRQSGAVLPARQREPDRLEFGGLAADRTGDADHFVSMGSLAGEVFTSIGSTYATEFAYPICVFWE
ncbi:MAG: hypothetical protein ACKV2T_07265 [Kofleriaceae bacterium]